MFNTAKDGPARPKRIVGEGRREQILMAARKLALRDGLDKVTLRAVAKECGLSAGLLLFHFDSSEALLLALLDSFLETLKSIQTSAAAASGTAYERLAEVTEAELTRLSRERATADVFFEFWVRGLRHPEIRRRMREGLRSYRKAILALTTEVVRERPDLFRGVSPKGLATMVVATIQGSVLQAVLDPRTVDLDDSRRAFVALSRAMADWKPRRRAS